MSSFNTKRVGKTALVLIGVAVLVGGSKLAYDDFVINAPLRKQANLLEKRKGDARLLGLLLSADEVDVARADGLALYDDFLSFDRFLLEDKALREGLATEIDYDSVATAIYANNGALEALTRATTLGNVSVPIEWGRGVSEHGPDLSVFNRYVEVLCGLATHSFFKGDTELATKYLEGAARITMSVTDEPTNRALLTWASCSNRLIRATYEMVEHTQTADAVKAATRILDMVQPPADLSDVVSNECLWFQVSAHRYDGMSHDDRMDLQLSPITERIQPPQGRFAGRAVESRSIAFWMEAAKNASPHDGDLLSTGQFLDNLSHEWLRDEDPSSYLSRALSGTFEQAAMGIMRVAQMKRLVVTAVGLISDYQSNGRLPDLLDTSDPNQTDPFGNVPFAYRKTARGFEILAIGQRTGGQIAPPVDDLRLVRNQGYALSFTIKP